MKLAVFDTETTDLPQAGDELGEHQPWPVSIAAVMFDDFKIISKLNILVRPPEGAFWHPRAVETHGITPELVAHEGHDMTVGMLALRAFLRDAEIVAAYNMPFDERIISSSSRRVGPQEFLERPVIPDSADKVCIMEAAAYELHGRVKLKQAYRILVGRELQDAHDAFADALAAAEVFKALVVRYLG